MFSAIALEKKLLTRLMHLKQSNLDFLGIKREIRGGGSGDAVWYTQ